MTTPNPQFDPSRASRFPQLDTNLLAALSEIEPSRLYDQLLYPCQVVLRDNRRVDRVYVAEAKAYIKHWGVWPEDDRGKRSIPVNDVISLSESPSRLPAVLANKLYVAGESSMGGCIFTVVLNDGRRLVCTTGNAVDFLDFPPDVAPSMVVDVLPHERQRSPGGSAMKATIVGAPYYWCLYSAVKS